MKKSWALAVLMIRTKPAIDIFLVSEFHFPEIMLSSGIPLSYLMDIPAKWQNDKAWCSQAISTYSLWRSGGALNVITEGSVQGWLNPEARKFPEPSVLIVWEASRITLSVMRICAIERTYVGTGWKKSRNQVANVLGRDYVTFGEMARIEKKEIISKLRIYSNYILDWCNGRKMFPAFRHKICRRNWLTMSVILLITSCDKVTKFRR